MSWRLIIAILLLAAGASAWGGLRLGDWLIIHSPTQIQSNEPPEEPSKTPVLDANGKPFVASAPQPLPDGRQGVPSLPPPVDWQVQAAPLCQQRRHRGLRRDLDVLVVELDPHQTLTADNCAPIVAAV